MNLVILKCTLQDDPKWYPNKKKGMNGLALMNVRTRNVSSGKWNDWHHVVAYGKIGQSCAKHLKGGMKLFLIGQIETSRYKQNDQWKKRVQIVVRSVTLDMHQWATEWLDLALQLAAQEQVEEEEDAAQE